MSYKEGDELYCCWECGKTVAQLREQGSKLLKCANCKTACYCNASCQVSEKKDWPKHKGGECVRASADSTTHDWVEEFRASREGRRGRHAGTLELITWEGVNAHNPREKLGWGSVPVDEADQWRSKFEVQLRGNPKKLMRHRPEAYRWTCCGVSGAGGIWGCDHHGDPSCSPCGCDFCRGGQPLPDDVWLSPSQHRQGLQLRRGPDTRALSPAGFHNLILRESFFHAMGTASGGGGDASPFGDAAGNNGNSSGGSAQRDQEQQLHQQVGQQVQQQRRQHQQQAQAQRQQQQQAKHQQRQHQQQAQEQRQQPHSQQPLAGQQRDQQQAAQPSQLNPELARAVAVMEQTAAELGGNGVQVLINMGHELVGRRVAVLKPYVKQQVQANGITITYGGNSMDLLTTQTPRMVVRAL